MNKIKLFFLITLAIFLSGCYTSFRTTGYTYSQIRVNIYFDYNFSCNYCYYEMYYCFHCETFHVNIHYWCTHHYRWYYSWYVHNYHHTYIYYYNHYRHHDTYRDNSRYYIRDRGGLRNHGGRNYDVIENKDQKKRNQIIDKKRNNNIEKTK